VENRKGATNGGKDAEGTNIETEKLKTEKLGQRHLDAETRSAPGKAKKAK
jgi:hypothetical protein